MKRGRCFSDPLRNCKRLCYIESRSSCGSNYPGVSKMSANEASSSIGSFKFSKGPRRVLKGYITEMSLEPNLRLPDWDALFAKVLNYEPRCSIPQIVAAIRKLKSEDMEIQNIIDSFDGNQDAILDAKAEEEKRRVARASTSRARRSGARTSTSYGAVTTTTRMANIRIENHVPVQNAEESGVNNNVEGHIWDLTQCFGHAQNLLGRDLCGYEFVHTFEFFQKQINCTFYTSLTDDQKKTLLEHVNRPTSLPATPLPVPPLLPYLSDEAGYPLMIQETQIINEQDHEEEGGHVPGTQILNGQDHEEEEECVPETPNVQEDLERENKILELQIQSYDQWQRGQDQAQVEDCEHYSRHGDEHLIPDNEQEVIWCPVCKQGALQEDRHFIYCNFCSTKLKRDDETINLDMLCTRLAEAHTEHVDKGCSLPPEFCTINFSRGTTLNIMCNGCNTFKTVA